MRMKNLIEVALLVCKSMKIQFLQLLYCFLLLEVHSFNVLPKYYKFVVKEVPYTRLCSTKEILTVNGQYPGPTIYAHKGDSLTVDVINQSSCNITIHWHGVKMPRNPWYDGPAYITQCPIQQGERFRQKIILSDEEGTLWWHAHSDYAKATVHGALIVYPKHGERYPFPKPYGEEQIVLGEWWKKDIEEVYNTLVQRGGEQGVSDALTINGQPGDFYPCSKEGTFKLTIEYGRTYLLRIIHAGMSELNFFAIANHELMVVGSDGSYIKPFFSDYITISPGQTIDVLLEANQPLSHYYMASKVFNPATHQFNPTTTTAIVKYAGDECICSPNPNFPSLPGYQDVGASMNFTSSMRNLANCDHDVPKKIDCELFYVVSMNLLPCVNNNSCDGPFGMRFATSINNMSFVEPEVSILDSYYYDDGGGGHQKIRVFDTRFPEFPLHPFNYTSRDMPKYLLPSKRSTEVKVLEFNSTVEIVFQGTNILNGTEHPMHLHGASFYVVGSGLGIFNPESDPENYNLIDPPHLNTISVPTNGWTTIRFTANNPGVWLMHCHIDRHMVWGMDTVFIVRDGESENAKIKPPPHDMPSC